MKITFKPLAGISAMLLAASVYADPIKTNFELGLETYQETYQEFVDGSKFMQEKATMVGVTSAVTARFADAHAIRVSARYAQGRSDYTGAYQGNSYGSLTSDGQGRNTTEVRATYQYHGALGGLPVMPSLGIGYRKLKDRLDESGPGGYRRENTLTFAALGLETTLPLGTSWTMTPKAGYNYVINGKQRSYIGNTLVNKQKSGHGFDVSADFGTKINSQMDLSITPFFRYWRMADSESATVSFSDGSYMVGYEPHNKTKEVGINLTMTFF